MAQLKEHMLHEVAADLCERVQRLCFTSNQNGPPSLEKFLLSGKEPARVLRRIVENDIAITMIPPTGLIVKYRDEPWWYNPMFLDILLILWAKKVCLSDFRYLNESPLSAYPKVMARNTGIEELRINNLNKSDNWPQILKTFPKLVLMRLMTESFALMLSVMPGEFICLKEVVFDDSCGKDALFAAHKALSVHQKKLPSLDTIYYLDTSLDGTSFPINARNVLSVKHLKVDAKVSCCTPFDYSFLPAAQKMFPSLESVEIGANVNCRCSYLNNKSPKLEVVKSFYEKFESLSFDFFIKVQYNEEFLSYQKDLAELRQFFVTKGKVYGGLEKFAVETSVPGKRLTYEATISVRPNPRSYSDAKDDYGDGRDYYYNMI